MDPDLEHRPSKDLLSEAHIGLINRWRHDCEAGHESCNKTSCNQLLPNRVLEILELKDEIELVRLLETQGKMKGAYACLSYCWGDSEAQSGQTTRDKLSGYLRGIPLRDLPSTVADAIRLSCKLGFRFLWVDRLCIVQDDHDDWANEASRMCDVYSGSALTISVPICKESSQSFLAKRRKGFREQRKFASVTHSEGESKLKSGSWFCAEALWRSNGPWFLEKRWPFLILDENHEENRWMTRGWTFQEWMLSPRVLHIDSMTMWDCFEGCANELNRRYMGDAKVVRDPTELGRGLAWESIVVEYSKREVARLEDKLPALAGLAARYARATGHTYLAGLWLEELPRWLLWRAWGPARRERPPGQRVPSWSWASRNGEVSRFSFPPHENFTARISILSAFCRYHPPDSFMAVEKAWIDVDGRVTGSLATEQDGDNKYMGKVKVGDEWWAMTLDGGVYTDDAIAEPSVYLLLVGSDRFDHFALVLHECGWEDGRQCFQRLGIAIKEESQPLDIGPSWEPRAIRLV